MKSKIQVSGAVISHIGNLRSNNEDNFYFNGCRMTINKINSGFATNYTESKTFHLFAVCDGMGGLEGGERAATICAEGLSDLDRLLPVETMKQRMTKCIMRMNEAVIQDAKVTGKGQKEGCTLALLYLRDNRGYVANVGDSRVYLLRQGKLEQVSMDHSMVYRMWMNGELTLEQMRKHPNANAITHYMGMPIQKVQGDFIYFNDFEIANGDRFLICSDGLTDLVPHERLTQILSAINTPMHIAEKLVLEALELSGKDNVTVIVGDISGPALSLAPGSEMTGMGSYSDSSTEQ